jgi:hypothetical protein
LLLPLMAVASHLGLIACDDVTVHEPVGPQRYTDSDFQYAARNGEIKTEVVGNPFGDDAGFAAAVVEHMQNAQRGPPARFVLAPERGGSEPYRVVMAFNPPRNATADQACARAAGLATTRGSQSIYLLAVFCSGETALSQASGTVGAVSDARDRKFRSLVRQVTRALIPAYDFKGPG